MRQGFAIINHPQTATEQAAVPNESFVQLPGETAIKYKNSAGVIESFAGSASAAAGITLWQAATVYPINAMIRVPASVGTLGIGDFAYATVAGTSGTTFNAAEVTRGGWTEIAEDPDVLLNSSIADNLTTDDATKVLSAKQGKVLQTALDTDTNFKRDQEYWVSDLVGSDTTGVGSRANPFKTVQHVIDLYGTISDHKIIYFDHYINENLVFNNVQNITVIGVGVNDSQQSNITGNHVVSGTSTRIRFKDTIMTALADDYILTYNGTQGRHYNQNASFICGASGKAVNIIGANQRWTEFYDCYVGGIVDCDSSNTGMTLKFTRQLAGEFVLNMNTFCKVWIYEAQRYNQINHTTGKLYINGLFECWRTSDTLAVNSTATSASGSYLELKNAKMRNTNNDFMYITKTGDCLFALSDVYRSETSDTLTGTQVLGDHDVDQKNNSSISGATTKDALDNIATALDGKLDAPIATFVEQSATPANPAAGSLKIYAKTDGKIYKLTSEGVETEIG